MIRYGGRPNRDRVMVSFYMSRAGKEAIRKLAKEHKRTQADVIRALLALGMADQRKLSTALRKIE